MTLFLIIISIIMGVLVISSSIMSFLNRRNIEPMIGMMAAMGVGMSVGLTMGVLIGALLQGNLLSSTILSIAVGILAGLLVGMPTSTLAVLDGALSGLMGGMMGAMLGVMVSIEDAVLLVKILLSVSICITFIFLLLFFKNKQVDESVNSRWLLRPITTFCLLLLLFLGLEQINVSSEGSHLSHDRSEYSPLPSKTIKIVTSGLKYNPNQITIRKSEVVELQLINNDDMEHDIEILSIKNTVFEGSSPQPNDSKYHQHNHYNQSIQPNSDSIIHIHANPKSVSSITFTPLMEGTYVYYCTIPGHKEGGMVGTLIVN